MDHVGSGLLQDAGACLCCKCASFTASNQLVGFLLRSGAGIGCIGLRSPPSHMPSNPGHSIISHHCRQPVRQDLRPYSVICFSFPLHTQSNTPTTHIFPQPASHYAHIRIPIIPTAEASCAESEKTNRRGKTPNREYLGKHRR